MRGRRAARWRRASARSAAGWWVKPANITCSNLAACSASAALSFGCECPCVQVHQEETRSRISLPSASNSEAPLAPASTIGSRLGAMLGVGMPDMAPVARQHLLGQRGGRWRARFRIVVHAAARASLARSSSGWMALQRRRRHLIEPRDLGDDLPPGRSARSPRDYAASPGHSPPRRRAASPRRLMASIDSSV